MLNTDQDVSMPITSIYFISTNNLQFYTISCLACILLPGMFANAEGVSQRAPVNWSESVIGAAVCFPYVVALDQDFISIHSMLDQQLKQSLAFRDGHILQDFEGT